MKIKLEALQLRTPTDPRPPGRGPRHHPRRVRAAEHRPRPRKLPTGVSFRLPHLFRFLPLPDSADCRVSGSPAHGAINGRTKRRDAPRVLSFVPRDERCRVD